MKVLTKEQIIELVNKIIDVEHYSEQEIEDMIVELEKGVIDPNISDYIFWDDLTPEEIADKALSYKPICM